MLVLPFRYGIPGLSILSNLHECKIVYLGNEYPSVENAYKSIKAEMLNRRELLPQIIRQILKQVQSVLSGMACHEWERVKGSVMALLLLNKFENCTEFRQKIQALNGLRVHIVEATRNNFWAIGCTPSELRSTHSSYWPGHNVMGQLLNMLVNASNNPIYVVADYMDLYVNSNFLPHARKLPSASRQDDGTFHFT